MGTRETLSPMRTYKEMQILLTEGRVRRREHKGIHAAQNPVDESMQIHVALMGGELFGDRISSDVTTRCVTCWGASGSSLLRVAENIR